jgi:diguanylate cyclase (GGDEF)-like protein/PAS domain S-box-containing protein
MYAAPFPWARNLRLALPALVATTLAYVASYELRTIDGEISPIWLANAALLAPLIVARRRQRYAVLAGGALGNLVARLLVGHGLSVSLADSFANLLEVVIALKYAPCILTVTDLIRLKPLVKFLLGGPLFAPMVSGLFIALLQAGQPGGSEILALVNWFASHALGLAIFTPAAVAFWTGEVSHLLHAGRRRKNGLLLLLVCVVTIGVFGQNRFHMLYWALPPIALLAFQADVSAVLVGPLMCLAIAVWFTMHGSGPFWIERYGSMQARILALQLYLVAALAIALPISVAQAQRDRLIARLRDGERRYQVLAENATDIVMSTGPDGRIIYVSPRVIPVLGYAPEDLIGVYYSELVLPDDRDAMVTAIGSLTVAEAEVSRDSRLRRPDGQDRWIKTYLRLVVDPFSGKPEMLTATVRDITERKTAEQRVADERRELQGLAFRDGLTGLFNRRHFDRELERVWRQHAQADSQSPVAAIMIDIDAFKNYNDHYGHQSGDECLRRVAQAIASAATRPTDVAARYGGEEFALILADTDQHGALIVAERIRTSIESLRISHPACPSGIVTISVGVAAQRPGHDGDGRALVAAADRALYGAKQRGRNRTCMVDTDVVSHVAG